MNLGKDQLRVAVAWPRFGPYHVARLEAAARRFRREGWAVVGLETARTDQTYAWNVTEGGDGFERVTIFPRSNYHDLSPRQIGAGVSRTLDRIAPEAVATVGWSFPEARAALGWCLRNGRTAVCMSDSKRDDVPRRWWKEWMKRLVVGQFDAALVAGKPHVEYAAALGIPRECIAVGIDVVDNQYFADAAGNVRRQAERLRAELNLPERHFLSCGRFIPKKNLERLLDAYVRYRDTCPAEPWGLVVAGSGELEARLHARAEYLRLPGVSWPGFIQVDDLPNYYGLASAFILPSLTEQWGLVVNEAMASGLPVLVSKVAGCRYDLVCEGDNGYLFDPLDIDDMAAAMRKMAALPDAGREAMGQRSAEIVAHWGPERFADGLWQAVTAALRGRSGKGWWDKLLGRSLTHPRFLTRVE